LHFEIPVANISNMFNKNTSIRKKIKRSFWAVFLFILLIAFNILINLILIEERVGFYEVISMFLDDTLEIRRYEKNYFLYRKQEDYYETLHYIMAAEKIIEENRKKFDAISSLHICWTVLFHRREIPEMIRHKASVETLNLLADYRKLLKKDFETQPVTGTLEEEIRHIGRELTEIAEGFARQEQAKIQGLLSLTRKSLIFSVILLFIGTAFLGRLISRIAIRPLKDLEKNMQKISSGRLEMLSNSSTDNEIVALTNAFNRMIREVFTHRDIIRAEKLASLGTMFAGIAHEINNPLSNISTSAQILTEEMDSSDPKFQQEMIEQIIDETERAKRIVRSVLEFSRDRGLKKQELNLLDLVRETFRFIRGEMPPHITLSVEIPPEAIVYGNKNKLEQALLNLMKNAIDAMPDVGKEEKLTLSAHTIGDHAVEISVTDTGKGIAESEIAKIFDPFFTTKDVGKGTGLGLFVAHEIIEEHGGTIVVKSHEGTGTNFIVTLPMHGENHESKDPSSDC